MSIIATEFIPPKTNWIEYELVTYIDINRIMNNCNYLYQNEYPKNPDESTHDNLPTDYTKANFLFSDQWQLLRDRIIWIHHRLYPDSDPPVITYDMSAENFNAVETWLFELYQRKYDPQYPDNQQNNHVRNNNNQYVREPNANGLYTRR